MAARRQRNRTRRPDRFRFRQGRRYFREESSREAGGKTRGGGSMTGRGLRDGGVVKMPGRGRGVICGRGFQKWAGIGQSRDRVGEGRGVAWRNLGEA